MREHWDQFKTEEGNIAALLGQKFTDLINVFNNAFRDDMSSDSRYWVIENAITSVMFSFVLNTAKPGDEIEALDAMYEGILSVLKDHLDDLIFSTLEEMREYSDQCKKNFGYGWESGRLSTLKELKAYLENPKEFHD
jgi:hypothetical protein